MSVDVQVRNYRKHIIVAAEKGSDAVSVPAILQKLKLTTS
jgi:hypothetical protein